MAHQLIRRAGARAIAYPLVALLLTWSSMASADPSAPTEPDVADGGTPAVVAPTEPVTTDAGAAPPIATIAPVAEPPAAPPPDSSPVELKIYGDTLFKYTNRGPVKTTFEAAHVDFFLTADLGRLNFLSEVFFEGRDDNQIAVDVERLQVAYLFGNAFRVRAGRSHTAFGYYNDTYHHGNIFELTADRPRGIEFEDEGGLLPAHTVGIGADGTIEAGKLGALRYDIEVGNGRAADTTSVAVVAAGKTEKMVNLRLRWLTPVDGLLFGINGLYDLVPSADATTTAPERPKVIEGIAGAHLVYMEHGVHFLAEAYDVHHVRSGGGTFATIGGFVELGYKLGAFPPYDRPEYIHFPGAGDPVFQQPGAAWANTSTVFDARIGVKWMPLPQIALKLEGERFAPSTGPQEIVTTKLAFGF